MLRNFRLSVCMVTLACLTQAALAQGTKGPGKDSEVIDVKSQAANFRVYTSEAGKFYVVPAKVDLDGMVFYGDGKTMHQQRIIGGGSSGDGSMDFAIWAPRAVNLQQGSLTIAADGCDTRPAATRRVTLTKTGPDHGWRAAG